jgi:hypothetical protein
MDFPDIAELNGGTVLLQVLLYLPSRDAFRVFSTFRANRSLLSSTCQDAEHTPLTAHLLWHHLASDQAFKGLHSADAVWLHALLDAPSIASYMKAAEAFTLVNDLRFAAPSDAQVFMVAMQSAVKLKSDSDQVGGDLFASLWRFDPQELVEISKLLIPSTQQASNCPAPSICSKPLRLCWEFQGKVMLLFELRLVFTFQLDQDSVAVSLEPRFLMESTDEERDYIELNIGGAMTMSSNFDHAAHLFHLKPFHGTLNDNFDAAQPYLPQSSKSVCRALQRGEHFICAFRVLLRSMGMEQRVSIFSGDEEPGIKFYKLQGSSDFAVEPTIRAHAHPFEPRRRETLAR